MRHATNQQTSPPPVPGECSNTIREAAPGVSICVPTCNGAAYLKECLASIQAQTFRDFEVVMVDDDSTDDSSAIAEAFAKRDSRFRLHRNARRLGLVGNWNRTLELSRGTWIKLLFQDDTIEPDCLRRLKENGERYQCPFVFCRRNFLLDEQVSDKDREFFIKHQALVADSFNGHMSAGDFARLAARLSAAWPGMNLIGEPTVTLFQRAVLEQFGMFNPALIQVCDAEFWIRVGSHTGVVHVAEPLATFRIHSTSTTSQNLAKRAYRSGWLDPLILRYLFLHDKNHQPMRRAFYQHWGRTISWWQCIQNAHTARQIARTAPSEGAEMAEWNSVVKIFPRLNTLATWGSLLIPFKQLAVSLGLARRLKKVST